MPDNELVWLDKASAAIERVATIGEAKQIADKAAAIKVYAAKAGWSQREKGRIAEIEVRASVRMGELLKKQPKATGTRGQLRGKDSSGATRKVVPEQTVPTNRELGITHKQAQVAQRAAEVSKGEREAYFAQRGAGEKKLASTTELARIANLAKRTKRDKTRRHQPLPPGVFEVLYADPPWQYDFCTTDDSRAIEKQYPTMTLDAIAALKVPAAKDAVLFLWATSPKLAEALHVMTSWGFSYRTCMVWVKDKIGMGYYARQRHELLLIGIRGKPGTPAESDRPDSVIAAKRGKHSEKPAVVYEIIERMYPKARRVEFFARGQREGWTAWGDEA